MRSHAMGFARKIVFHIRDGYRPELDALIESFIRDGVAFVGVVGEDCARIEDIIDEICVGDGSHPYEMLTTSHPNETITEAVRFARSLEVECSGEVEVVEF
jgi:hypothetical protein